MAVRTCWRVGASLAKWGAALALLAAVVAGCSANVALDDGEAELIDSEYAELLQCAAQPISQFADPSSSCGGQCCDSVDCGPTSAAMMRYIMANGAANANVRHDHHEMRRWYREFNGSSGCYASGSKGYQGASLSGVTKLLKRVYQKDGGPDYSADCNGGGANCTQSVGGSWTQEKFINKIEDGYVAAVIGDCEALTKYGRGSPCCSDAKKPYLDHFVVVSGYDDATDQLLVMDPACSGSKKKVYRWEAKDFFRFAWGGAGYVKTFVYGKGKQCGESSGPTCTPTKTCAGKCGSVWDGCKYLSCGGCNAPETCGGGGVDNVCGYGEDYDPETSFPVASWSTGTIQNSGSCMEASGSSNAVFMTACSASDLKQNWLMIADRRLKNYATGRCAQAESAVSGALVKQQSCSTSSLQQWRTTNMEIVNGKTGFCLNVPFGDHYDGAPVRYRPCSGKEQQRFNYNLATRQIRPSGDTRFCLDVENAAGVAAGNDVKLRPCDGTLSQQWDDGRGGFVNRAAEALCLAVEGGAEAGAGADAEVATCNDAVGQMWALRGQVALQSAPSSCLQAGPPGSHPKLSACNAGSSLQVFTLFSQF